MKKTLLLCLLGISAAQISTAQNSPVNGNVKDDKGNALRYAFVEDAQDQRATFSDSLGNFNMTAPAGAKLQISLPGYESAAANAASNLQVTLKSTGAATQSGTFSAQVQTQKSDDNLNTYGTGGVLAPGHQKGNVHGNQYLFNTFVPGYFIQTSGELVYDPNARLDYDKIGGLLLRTTDNKTMGELSTGDVKSFSLFGDHDKLVTFVKLPAVDQTHYVQSLASGKKYNIYKTIKTKFVHSDYVNTGVSSHGNDYDEYVDDSDYYVTAGPDGQPKKLSLRKKGIKEAFAADADKVSKFMSENSGDIDDDYLSKLGDYLNQ